MSVRELGHPDYEIREHVEGLVLRFWVPGSSYGPVELIIAPNDATALSAAIIETLVDIDAKAFAVPAQEPQ